MSGRHATPLVACTPFSVHDDSVKGCYSWCSNNMDNCHRCKCQLCATCKPPPFHHAVVLEPVDAPVTPVPSLAYIRVQTSQSPALPPPALRPTTQPQPEPLPSPPNRRPHLPPPRVAFRANLMEAAAQHFTMLPPPPPPSREPLPAKSQPPSPLILPLPAAVGDSSLQTFLQKDVRLLPLFVISGALLCIYLTANLTVLLRRCRGCCGKRLDKHRTCPCRPLPLPGPICGDTDGCTWRPLSLQETTCMHACMPETTCMQGAGSDRAIAWERRRRRAVAAIKRFTSQVCSDRVHTSQ